MSLEQALWLLSCNEYFAQGYGQGYADAIKDACIGVGVALGVVLIVALGIWGWRRLRRARSARSRTRYVSASERGSR